MSNEHKSIEAVGEIYDTDCIRRGDLSHEDYEKIKPFRSLLLSLSNAEIIEVHDKLRPIIAKLLCIPLEQTTEIIVDHFRYMQWQSQIVRFMTRVEALLENTDTNAFKRKVPLKLTIDFLFGTLREPIDEIRDLWMAVLINSVNPDSNVPIKRVYRDTLRILGSVELKILRKIYGLPFQEIQHQWIVVKDLPDTVTIMPPGSDSIPGPVLSEVDYAICTLTQYGIVSHVNSSDGLTVKGFITPSNLGRVFIEACAFDKQT